MSQANLAAPLPIGHSHPPTAAATPRRTRQSGSVPLGCACDLATGPADRGTATANGDSPWSDRAGATHPQRPVQRARRRVPWTLLVTLIFASTVRAQSDGSGLATGRRFREALRKPLSGSWEQVDLRTICQRVQSAGHVSLLLDRRIDPSAPLDFSARELPVEELVQGLVAHRDARAVAVGNTVYLGPAAPTGRLRTLVALRQDELVALVGRGAPRRLLEASDVAWEDLDSPARLVSRIAAAARLEVRQAEQIPPDLWGAAELPEVTLVEALSLILIQFDLTFAWQGGGRAIEIVAAPEEPLLTRPHPAPRGTPLTIWREQVEARLPHREIRVERSRLLVEATLEEHEALGRSPREVGTAGPAAEGRPADQTSATRRTISGPGAGQTKSEGGQATQAGPARGPEDRQRYTLRLQDKPILALLKTLERPEHGGWRFEYSQEELTAAGRGLDRRISLEVREVRMEELLDKALGPAGLVHRREGRTIVIEAQP